MPTPPMSRKEADRTIAAIRAAIAAGHPAPGVAMKRGQIGALSVASASLGIARSSMTSRLRAIAAAFPTLDLHFDAPDEPLAPIPPAAVPARARASVNPIDDVRARLRLGGATLDELRALTGLGASAVKGLLADLEADGFNVAQYGETFAIPKSPPLPAGPAALGDEMLTLVSRPDNSFLFGASGDQHLGSKYERLDVLNDLYDRFADAGVQAVYNTGNWIEGEARFNRHELKVHGMEAQCRYLAKHFPHRPGIVTYAVAGDDHEGWYAQREGVDIGRFAERIMREEGRDDWVNLGYIEGYVRLVNANTGKSAILQVMHPGGGSAYAVSYAPQKIVEAFDGGEKPDVLLIGHYHKLSANNIRNVWVIQTGTTKDQDTFMRKKRIDAHVGAVLVGLEQDPETGAIIGCTTTMQRYFNTGYYAGRWSLAGPARLPERAR